MKFDGKIVLVAGGASGIGFAAVEGFAALGAEVYLGDLNEEAGKKAAASVSGGKVHFVKLDVTDKSSIHHCRDRILTEKGRLDVLANVAGWGHIQPFVENSDEFIDKIVKLNLMGPIEMARAFFPSMIERKSGKIVIVASDAGRVGSLGESVYSGAKGGAISFTKSLAREGARHNIQVNCVCPGPTDTPLLRSEPEKFLEAFLKAIPMKRFGKPSEVADAVIFMASNRADYITGQVLSVNGGLVIPG